MLTGVTVALVTLSLYLLAPRLAGLAATWRRLDDGDPWWLILSLGFELASFTGYVVVFHEVCARGAPRIDWRESREITFAGVAATRLLAAAGAGGIALTAWALRHAGLGRATVTRRLSALLVLLYAVYLGALVAFGTGLWLGVLSGRAPVGATVVPALLAATVIVLVLLMAHAPRGAALPAALLARLPIGARRRARMGRVPALLVDGVRDAIWLAGRRRPALLGAVAWWAFDLGALWACFRAFGGAPAMGPLVMAYLVGMAMNALPLPGGVGGVEGGMIGMLIALDVPAGLAVVAVLAYRVVAFWLPTVPGVLAYLRLRRRYAVNDAVTPADRGAARGSG